MELKRSSGKTDSQLAVTPPTTINFKIKPRWALFVTYTIIQSITSSEMCSLHFYPSKCTHTWSSGQSSLRFEVRCLAQASHLSHGQFQPELRFEPTTSGYKSNAQSTRPRVHSSVLTLAISLSHRRALSQLWVLSNRCTLKQVLVCRTDKAVSSQFCRTLAFYTQDSFKTLIRCTDTRLTVF